MNEDRIDYFFQFESFKDIENQYQLTFEENHRKEEYKKFGDSGDDRQIQQAISAGLDPQSSQNKLTILDYGTGKGALVPTILTRFDNISSFICVNHENECDETGKHINDYLKKEINNWQINNNKPNTIEFKYYTDTELINKFEQNNSLNADFTYCIDVLHHIPLSELPKKIFSMLYHTKLNGNIIICTISRPTHFEVNRFWWDLAQDLELLFKLPELEFKATNFGNKTVTNLVIGKVKKVSQFNMQKQDEVIHRLMDNVFEIYRKKFITRITQLTTSGSILLEKKSELFISKNDLKSVKKPADREIINKQIKELEKQLFPLYKEFLFLQISFRDIIQQLTEASHWKPTLIPGEKCVVITFRQTISGEEESSYAILKDRLKKNNRNGKVLITLGQYDLVTIEEFVSLNDFRIASQITYPFEKVFNINSHACFTIAGIITGNERISISQNFEKMNELFIGICFLKLNPLFINNYGIQGESMVIKRAMELYSEKYTEQCQICILGSFGWNEINILISSNSPEIIYNFVTQLREYTDFLALKNETVFLTSFTVLGVEKENLEKADEVLNSIDFIIGLSNFAGKKQQLEHYLLKDNPMEMKWNGVFGKMDYLGIKKKGSNIIRKILNLRKQKEISSFLTTTTIPLIDLKENKLSDKEKFSTTLSQISIESSSELRFSKKLEEIQKNAPVPTLMIIRKMLSEYIHCSYDPLVCGNVADLQYCIQKICPEIISSYNDWVEKNKAKKVKPDLMTKEDDKYYTASELILFGIMQRYSGSYETIYNLNDINISGLAVGVQRLLCASEAIIWSVLKQNYIRYLWNGFVVYAKRRLPFREIYGIFNFSGEDSFDLVNMQQLWYLHEIGHEITATPDIDPFFLIDVTAIEEEILQQKDMLREMIADIFLIITGFNGDFQSYLTTFKNYLSPRLNKEYNKTMSRRYFLRLFAVYAYCVINELNDYEDLINEKVLLGQFTSKLYEAGYIKEKFYTDKETYEWITCLETETIKKRLECINKLLNDLESISTKFKKLNNTRDYLLYEKNSLEHKPERILKNIIQLVIHWKKHIFDHFFKDHYLWCFNGDEMIIDFFKDKIEKGEIITCPFLNWHKIVQKLNKQDNATLKQNVAMILSLWHTWKFWLFPCMSTLRNECSDNTIKKSLTT